ncbi:unnamed protein product [Bursaphelenchus xylophilus]|uniref:(pine wood nematode) hypothetical protein n=1 Tax=Bursaphelenchus xylophilus TaxID=6326 RepID=A0A1I7SG20_BURXY|nr:unnamed protein product [Bursaphelenchus xylophilus]CAG9126275.1 unnamed protein product [Bursaphelenchus xylophilus]
MATYFRQLLFGISKSEAKSYFALCKSEKTHSAKYVNVEAGEDQGEHAKYGPNVPANSSPANFHPAAFIYTPLPTLEVSLRVNNHHPSSW